MRESEPITYEPSGSTIATVKESDIEEDFIQTLVRLKYTHRPDIRDRAALEANFREKFQRLNAVTLSDSEFARLLDQITTPDVYKSAEGNPDIKQLQDELEQEKADNAEKPNANSPSWATSSPSSNSAPTARTSPACQGMNTKQRNNPWKQNKY